VTTKQEKTQQEKINRLAIINKLKELPRTPSYSVLKAQDHTFYGIQKLRIQTGNRIVAGFLKQLGLTPGDKKEDGLDKLAQDLLVEAVKDYKFLADYVVDNKTTLAKAILKSKVLIGSVPEYNLIENYMSLLNEEKETEKGIAKYLESFPVWSEYLKHIPGCGTLMGAVIISGFDIHKCQYVSTMWAYAGYDVIQVQDSDTKEFKMEGRCRKEQHLVKRDYINKDGKPDTRMGISFNPFIKTKLNVLLGSFLKLHSRFPNKYAPLYYNAKLKYQGRRQIALLKEMKSSNLTEKAAAKIVDKFWNKTHIHLMSVRIAMKTFLQDLYPVWRSLEGLEVVAPYHERVLGLPHHDRDVS
jgi:hypothetical protein